MKIFQFYRLREDPVDVLEHERLTIDDDRIRREPHFPNRHVLFLEAYDLHRMHRDLPVVLERETELHVIREECLQTDPFPKYFADIAGQLGRSDKEYVSLLVTHVGGCESDLNRRPGGPSPVLEEAESRGPAPCSYHTRIGGHTCVSIDVADGYDRDRHRG